MSETDTKFSFLKINSLCVVNKINSISTALSATPDERILAEAREKVRLEYEAEMAKLREEYAAEQHSKTQLQGDLERLRVQYKTQMTSLNDSNNNNKVQTVIISFHKSY